MSAPSLEGRTIIVTGASRGIGEAAAELFAGRGAGVGLLARSADRIGALAAKIRAQGGRALSCPCNVSSPGSVAEAYARIREELGPADSVLNNAGVIAPIGRLHDTDPAAWAENIAINLVGAYNVLHAVLPDLLSSKRGVVVNMSSGAAARPNEGWSAYCAGKAGLMMLTGVLNVEYGPEGLAAFGLRPGLVDTDMQVQIRASGINAVSRIPRENLSGANVAAEAAAWLIATAPPALRGQDVDVRDDAFRQLAGLDSSGSSK